MESAEKARALLAVVAAHADPAALTWLERGVPRAQGAFARGVFFGFYAGAGRRFSAMAVLAAGERTSLIGAGIRVPEVWSSADLVRAGLLLSALAVTPAGDHVGLATEAFRKGDSAERVALLRALPLLPEPARFVPLAIEACRTHVLEVFAAIACENPLPAAEFPQLNFNQLVIKALFMELSLERVLDWRTRTNPELVRIASDYEAERRAAGRSVPADIATLVKATGESR